MKQTIAKGLFDILPYLDEGDFRYTHYYRYVEEIIHQVAFLYQYSEIRTPVFEKTEVFARSVGTTSDIVTKEMYTFEDKGKRSLSLRPEGTASVIRSFVEKSLDQRSKNNKLYYISPMFRYERPQKGRYRQHHQFGVEAIGNGSAEQDVEVIDLLLTLYEKLGLKNLNLMINTVGDKESRDSFRKEFVSYLIPLKEKLSEDSKVRLEKNPLRILDSKDKQDQELLKNAPLLQEHLTSSAKENFEELKALLKSFSIPFVVNNNLVRGLDYYNKTVFEVTAEALGAQISIGGGGRYDGLISTFGGPDLPAIGFGTGIERIIQTMIAQEAPFPEEKGPKYFFIPLEKEAKTSCFSLVHELRKKGISCEIDLKAKKIKNSLQQANTLKAESVVIIGSEELEKKVAVIKNMNTREQIEVPFDKLIETMEK